MTQKIEKSDNQALERILNIDKKRDPITLLQQVLRMDIKYSKDKNLFFKYFYSENRYIQDKAIELIGLIEDNTCPFILIHGYSKNGKSTFIEYCRYLNNNRMLDKLPEKKFRYIIDTFDFEKSKIDDNYLNSVKIFYYSEFSFLTIYSKDKLKNICKELDTFLRFYNIFKTKLTHEFGFTNSASNYFLTYCENIFDNIKIFLENIQFGVKSIKDSRASFHKLILDKLTIENSADYLTFLILFKIFRSRHLILHAQKKYQTKLIFTFDNLDDYLLEDDIQFLEQPQIKLSNFIQNLTSHSIISRIFSESLKESLKKERPNLFNISEEHIELMERIKIIYVFRTANMLVFTNLIKGRKNKELNSLEKYFPECLLNREYMQFNTVLNTDRIIRDRLDFYKQVVNQYDLKKPEGIIFLEALTENLTYNRETESKPDDSKNIFRLWNGDKRALWDKMFSRWPVLKKKYFPYEENVIQKVLGLRFYRRMYLLRGIYIYLFLEVFKNNFPGLFKEMSSYRVNYKPGKKNIQRFLLNYLINISEDRGKPETVNETDTKGVGFEEMSSKCLEFVNRINKISKSEIYSINEVKDFFNNITGKIDYFGQIVSIYKSQIILKDNKYKYTNYYDLFNEYESFKTGDQKDELNKIRIFNNDNASYIARYLVTYFEFFSFSISQDGKRIPKKPLLFSCIKKKNISKVSSAKDFEFYDIIENVIQHVEDSINTLVEFYIKYLIQISPPQKFVRDKFYTVFEDEGKGSFLMRLIVSRHITYIESFRRAILEEVIIKLDNAEKTIVNKYLVEKIKKYIKIYHDNYIKITHLATPTPAMAKTFAVNQEYDKIAHSILNDPSDFTTIIDIE